MIADLVLFRVGLEDRVDVLLELEELVHLNRTAVPFASRPDFVVMRQVVFRIE